MGYTLTIGEARGQRGVEVVELPDAPQFASDDTTGNSNVRSPSYTGWGDFIRATGTHDLFAHPTKGLIRKHPGRVALTKWHLAQVTAAIARMDEQLGPDAGQYGFETEDSANYCRLLWMEWWIGWALDNCDRPSFANS